MKIILNIKPISINDVLHPVPCGTGDFWVVFILQALKNRAKFILSLPGRKKHVKITRYKITRC